MFLMTPNSSDSTRKNLFEYLLKAEFIPDRSGVELPIQEDRLYSRSDFSWYFPIGC